ncbi:hypothetical protein PYW07_007557 [Mythimna separata]|uniref:Down syndrome cell adhesion molecule-like protein Dscam2 n=1 Tax=Mythimna separata TaxID=271217 RepID=A0AAD7Z415_MYTSE|nr:hypothetical protein PYW07_007557 [Mythimna separata]
MSTLRSTNLINVHSLAPEAPPERVRCEALSAQSVRVWWEPPPPALRGGVLLGYEVLYETVDELDSQVETRRSGGMETVLQALQRAANYSIAVRARTAAGTGPTSEPVYCVTHEDIPGAPMDIKAVASSEDTVVVSWLAPLQKNGKIKHYTVYNRPQRTGQHSQMTVHHKDEEEEYQVEVRGLQEHLVYEFWVTAATASGEGEMSAIVARKPNGRAPAKITSFGRRLEAVAGRRARVRCAAAGAPPPHRAWARARPAPPLAHDTNYLLDGAYLVILKVDRGSADNYTCTVRNPWGEERASWELRVLAPPARPALRLAAAAPARLHLVWEKPHTGGSSLHDNYTCTVRNPWGEERASWELRVLAPPARPALRLAAAAPARLHLVWEKPHTGGSSLHDNYTCTVRNPWGEERASWELRVLAPPARPALRLAAAAPARLHLVWEKPHTGGSSLHGYLVEHARSDDGKWQSTRLPGDSRTHTLERLACGTLYRVRLTAYNAVGSSPPSDELVVSTKGGPSKASPEKDLITTNSSCVRLNLLTWDSNGCPLTQFAVSVRSFEESAWITQTVSPAAQPTVLCGLALATWYHLKVVATSAAGTTLGNYYFSTLTEGGERIPAPAHFPPGVEEGEEKATAVLAAAACGLLAAFLLLAAIAYKRSPTTSCFRKGYEQGDISEEEDKSVEKRDNRRNCQQVYTSSPIKHPIGKKDQQEMYEISPYATFSMSGGATGPGAEEGGTLRTFGRAEPAPLQAAPPRAHHHHLQHENADEYTLSRAMTLMVRRSESDSDSSGSPCAECNSSVSYRMPVTPGKVVPDEVFRAVTDSSAESAADARSVSARAHDKARRRARRHHTPTSSRYQQRQEQERRDFTIHV